jgi:ATP-dependent DNA helicase PIF1
MFKTNPIAMETLKQMEETTNNLYITGDAGTGKSTLLREFMKNTKKDVVILAPTGLAALHVGGETIHRFCKFSTNSGLTLLSEDKIHKLRDSKKIATLQTIIIDEVSMVRSDLFDALDMFFRKNTGRKTLPFGGIQVILFGDHFQLPPIVQVDEKLALSHSYQSEHFFDSNVYSSLGINNVKLTKNYRQNDAEFIKLLGYLRKGINQPSLIDWINRKCFHPSYQNEKEEGVISITSTNANATNINYAHLEYLKGDDRAYKAFVYGNFTPEQYPTEKYLVLKIGAQVMFIRNDKDKRWVNGSIGIITDMADKWVEVKIGVMKVRVETESWETHNYEYDEEEGKTVQRVTGEFVQLPLKLAWAVTIHKSQGQTFEACNIDLGRGAFVSGQTYVAFSRCKTIEGLKLLKPLKARDIITDQRVIDFDQACDWNKDVPEPVIKKTTKKMAVSQ